MTALVANITLSSAATRIARNAGARLIDGVQSSDATPGRGQTSRYSDTAVEPGTRPRRAAFQDQVVSYGGVLVSLEVGSTIVQAQTLNGFTPTAPAEAERQVANYEFAQSLFGPAQPIVVSAPFAAQYAYQ